MEQVTLLRQDLVQHANVLQQMCLKLDTLVNSVENCAKIFADEAATRAQIESASAKQLKIERVQTWILGKLEELKRSMVYLPLNIPYKAWLVWSGTLAIKNQVLTSDEWESFAESDAGAAFGKSLGTSCRNKKSKCKTEIIEPYLDLKVTANLWSEIEIASVARNGLQLPQYGQWILDLFALLIRWPYFQRQFAPNANCSAENSRFIWSMIVSSAQFRANITPKNQKATVQQIAAQLIEATPNL